MRKKLKEAEHEDMQKGGVKKINQKVLAVFCS